MTLALQILALLVVVLALVVEVRRRRSLRDYRQSRTVRANLRRVPGFDDCIVTYPIAPGVHISKNDWLRLWPDGCAYPGLREDGNGRAVEDAEWAV